MDYINSSKTEGKLIEEIKEKLKRSMSAKLYEHSIGTRKYASVLLKKHYDKIAGISGNRTARKDMALKVSLAALLHDYAKIFSYEELIGFAGRYGWNVDSFALGCRPILHSFIGDFLVERDFGIHDRDILDSIKYHSTGRKNMGIIEKIIYISDKIEQTRDYMDIGLLRKFADRDIDTCLLEVYKRNIIYVLNKNQSLYPKTCGIWNEICGGVDLNVI